MPRPFQNLLTFSSPVARYGLAIFSFLIATGLSVLADHYRFPNVQVPLYLFAIALTAWYAGSGPAAVTVLLSIFCFDYLFTEPRYTLYVTVSGYSELPQRHAAKVLDEKGHRFILMILDSAKRMGNLIDDLLSFSRVGRAETQKTNVNLPQLVSEALTDFRQETRGRDISWKIGELPDLYGDRAMLRLVLVNLLSNAIKFTPARMPKLRSVARREG